MDNYSWAKQFGKEGFSIFDEKSVKILRAMQRKYSDFHAFFTQLTLLYKGQRMTKEQEVAAKTISLIEKTVAQIDNLLDIKAVPTKETADELFALTTQIDKNINFFRNNGPDKLSKAMQERIKKAEGKTEISLEALEKSSSAIQTKLKTIGRTKKEPGILKSTLGQAASSFAGDLAQGVLGPLAGLAMGGVDLYKKHRANKQMQSEKALAGDLVKESERTPEVQKELYDAFNDNGKGKVPETVGEKSRASDLGPGAFEKGLGKSSGVGGAIGAAAIGTALFTFFNTEAYRAKWTNELLNTLKDIARGGSGSSLGDLAEAGGASLLKSGLAGAAGGATAGAVASALTLAGTVALTILGAVTILGLGLAIGAAISKPVDEFLQKIRIGKKGLSERIGDTMTPVIAYKAYLNHKNKKAIKEQREGMSPDMIKSLEIQDANPGMSVTEANDIVKEGWAAQFSPEEIEKIDADIKSPYDTSETQKETEIKLLNKTIQELNSNLSQKSSGQGTGNAPATSIGDPWIEGLSAGFWEAD